MLGALLPATPLRLPPLIMREQPPDGYRDPAKSLGLMPDTLSGDGHRMFQGGQFDFAELARRQNWRRCSRLEEGHVLTPGREEEDRAEDKETGNGSSPLHGLR